MWGKRQVAPTMSAAYLESGHRPPSMPVGPWKQDWGFSRIPSPESQFPMP